MEEEEGGGGMGKRKNINFVIVVFASVCDSGKVDGAGRH